MMTDDAPLWVPSPERAEATRLAAFRRRAGAPDYEALHAWSIERPEEFWPLVWDDCGVVGDQGASVIERGEHFADTRFFPDARLSVAENLLWPRAGVDPDADALVAVDETGRACRDRGTSCVPTRQRWLRRSVRSACSPATAWSPGCPTRSRP